MLERSKGLADEPNMTYRKYKESTHVSDRPSDQSTQLGHLSHLDSCYHSRSKKNYNSVQCRLSGKNCVFYVGTTQRISLSSDDFYSYSTLVLGLIRVEFFKCFVLTPADDL
jgi:hypothetical protein